MKKLAIVKLKEIVPNPDNPRGIDIPNRDPKLYLLKDSIARFGIMVPLVLKKTTDGYVLIDGERRYWAAKSLGLPDVPAFILDDTGDLTAKETLYRMFQIHHNREQWGPVMQCHALEGLYSELMKRKSISGISNIRSQNKAIAEEIVSQTGIEFETALNRIFFLRWPTEIKKRLYDNPEEEGYWYICEIEGKIIIPALLNYPEYFDKVPVETVREGLFKKLEEHTIERSTDVRRVAPYLRDRMDSDADRKKVGSALKRLHSDSAVTYIEIQEELQREFPEVNKPVPPSPKKLLNLLHSLETALEEFDYSALGGKGRKSQTKATEIIAAAEKTHGTLGKFIKILREEGR